MQQDWEEPRGSVQAKMRMGVGCGFGGLVRALKAGGGEGGQDSWYISQDCWVVKDIVPGIVGLSKTYSSWDCWVVRTYLSGLCIDYLQQLFQKTCLS